MHNLLPLIQTKDLSTGYTSGRRKITPIAGPLAIEIYPGQLICLLGPNGSGKSTLLRTLAGLQSPLKGAIYIDGVHAGRLRPNQLAKKISLVLTDAVKFSNLTVYSLVALGRYPYSNWLGILSNRDQSIIDQAIAVTGIEKFLQRKVSTLSDGECQKVMLARALTQDTPLLMLDEPTAHLDLPSRIQLMRLLHQLAMETNKGILLSTHELDLALQVADEVWLLQGGGKIERGTPEDLVLNGTFEAAFHREGIRFDKTTGAFHIHQTNGEKIGLTGHGAPAFWTKRALQRRGFTVTMDQPAALSIRIVEESGRTSWILVEKDREAHFESIAGLLLALNGKTGSKLIS